jgi:hypothetical protein
VDNDPMVAAHARDLLDEGGTTRFIEADVRDPASILDDPQVRELVELSQPAGLLITAVLHFVPDEGDPPRTSPRPTATGRGSCTRGWAGAAEPGLRLR